MHDRRREVKRVERSQMGWEWVRRYSQDLIVQIPQLDALEKYLERSCLHFELPLRDETSPPNAIEGSITFDAQQLARDALVKVEPFRERLGLLQNDAQKDGSVEVADQNPCFFIS